MQHIAEEFSSKLMDLSKFWFPALLNADTGIGRTMRFLLKLEPSSTHPLIQQYKGVEIRSFREKRISKRNALCCMVPIWKESNYKSAKQLLEAYGYLKDGSKLYQNTVYYGKNNAQGLQLVIDEENDRLKLVDGKTTDENRKEVAVWSISKIKDYISNKHNETFWIGCENKIYEDKEFFRIARAEHSIGPTLENLCDLLRGQMISLDIILGRKTGGDMFAFKLNASATRRLFPQSEILIYNNDTPMKYCDWNQLLINYYFINKGDEPIFLAITKEELVDYAIENTTMFPALLAKVNKTRRDRGDKDLTLEEYVWNDFIRNCGVTNKATLFSRLKEEICNTRNDSNGMPHFLPLFAYFMMPLSKYPELHAKDYYEHLEKFLRDEHVIDDIPLLDNNGNKKNLFNTSDFTNIKQVMKFMWSSMQNWAQTHGFNYELKRDFKSERGNEYVDMFLAECLFTSVQLDRFKIVFSRSSLTQDEEIDDEVIVRILENAYVDLGINRETWRGMLEKNRRAIISNFRREYEKWDGETVITQNVNNRAKIDSYGKTSNLYLGMLIMQDGSTKFFLDLFSKNSDDNDLLSFTSEDGSIKVKDIRITYNGFGNHHILANPDEERLLCEIVNNEVHFILKDDNYKDNKAIFKPNEFFLFVNNSGAFTSRSKYELGRQYFIMIKNSKKGSYDSWLQENDAIVFKGNLFDNNFTLYRIDSAKTELIGSSQLCQKHLVTIKLNHTIVLSKRSGEAIVLCKDFDAFFSITGLNVSVDKVKAISTEGRKKVIDLEYIEEHDLWKLTPPKNAIELCKEYMLCVNDSILNSNRYKFCDFSMLGEDEYSEIEYDKLGRACDNGIYKGLFLNDTTPTEIDSLKKEIENASKEDIPNSDYANTDFFLYALSAFPILKKSEIKEILNSFFFMEKYIEPNESYYLNNILGDYFRLGYLNEKYVKGEGKHLYAINKPSLLWISPRFTKEKQVFPGKKYIEDKVKTIYRCQENNYKFLFTGARTPDLVNRLIEGAKGRGIKVEVRNEKSALIPQTIFFHSPSLKIIEDFASTYNLVFQKCIYANSMLQFLPALTEYEEAILATDEIEMDEKTRFRAIDYTILANKFAEGESSILNRDIETRTINTNASFITYYPGTYKERCVIWKDGKAYETDKHWGHFLGLSYVNRNIISYDEEAGTLSVPLQIKLPDLMARAITMITGELPVVENGKRNYKVSLNPFAFKTDPNKIINRLKK